MYMIEVELVPATGHSARPPSDRLVQDVFWPLARRDDGLEHLKARVGHDRIAVVLFVGSSDEHAAVEQSRALCERVRRTAPVLSGWTIARCEPVAGLI